MSDPDADRALILRIASGDRAAMRRLYDRYHDGLFAFLRSRGADAQEAADGVQDAMLAVWRTAHRYTGAASVKTWIFTIARNKYIDRLRKSARYSLVDDVPEAPDDSPNAEAVMEAASDAARLTSCLNKLKPAHLTAIRLSFYEDLTYSEIAEMEDVPAGTIKTRIFHAKKLLLQCLGRR